LFLKFDNPKPTHRRSESPFSIRRLTCHFSVFGFNLLWCFPFSTCSVVFPFWISSAVFPFSTCSAVFSFQLDALPHIIATKVWNFQTRHGSEHALRWFSFFEISLTFDFGIYLEFRILKIPFPFQLDMMSFWVDKVPAFSYRTSDLGGTTWGACFFALRQFYAKLGGRFTQIKVETFT
jgi:hypothetical protein